MASEVHSYSVKEDDQESKDRIERLAFYANTKGISLSNVILQALKNYEKEIDKIWQPKKKR